MRENNSVGAVEDEINLFDIVSFLGKSWKTILIFCVAGGLAAGAFVMVVQKQYAADALISVAQILDMSNNNNGNLAIGGSNKNNGAPIQTLSFETPALLIERLKKPTTYTLASIKACGLDEKQFGAETMSSIVQATAPKTLSSLVEITVRRNNAELAKQCAEGVFTMIREQQNVMLKPYLEETHNTLKELETRLVENKAFVDKMEKAGLYQTVYLAKRDESLYLTQQISEMKRAMLFNNQAFLVAPVYAPAKAVYPVRSKSLVFGAMAGLLIGLFVALTRQLLMKWRRATTPA